MIVFIAPYPRPGEVREGWMSRISAIDRLFSQERRTYVQIVDDGTSGLPEPYHVSDLVDVYYLNLTLLGHYDKLRNLILGADMVYVHTIHLARYVLPFYNTGKIITDIHGVTPEEEMLYGKPGVAQFYEEVERVVLAESRHAVVVTNAMADHYRRKYPASGCEFTVLPIFETIYPRADQRLTAQTQAKRPKVIYSGGAQRWQNVDLMLDLAKAQIETCDFTFLSHESAEFEERAETRGIRNRITFRSVKKEKLANFYLDADFGFVLRDDIAVNRVSCPTKLSEYLWFGVIPVVLSPALGDFEALGYRYVSRDDFLAGRLPAPSEQLEMRARNFEAISTLQDSFEAAAAAVTSLPERVSRSSFEPLAFLSDLERNVIFPALSELHLTLGHDSAPSQILAQYFGGPFRHVEFDLSEVTTVRRLTWMPINRECRIRLDEVRIESRDGTPVPYTVSGNFDSFSDGVVSFSVRYPRMHFDVEGQAGITAFSACFDFILLGSEVPTAAGAPLQGEGTGMVQRLKDRLKVYPSAIKAYLAIRDLQAVVRPALHNAARTLRNIRR